MPIHLYIDFNYSELISIDLRYCFCVSSIWLIYEQELRHFRPYTGNIYVYKPDFNFLEMTPYYFSPLFEKQHVSN